MKRLQIYVLRCACVFAAYLAVIYLGAYEYWFSRSALPALISAACVAVSIALHKIANKKESAMLQQQHDAWVKDSTKPVQSFHQDFTAKEAARQ